MLHDELLYCIEKRFPTLVNWTYILLGDFLKNHRETLERICNILGLRSQILRFDGKDDLFKKVIRLQKDCSRILEFSLSDYFKASYEEGDKTTDENMALVARPVFSLVFFTLYDMEALSLWHSIVMAILQDAIVDDEKRYGFKSFVINAFLGCILKLWNEGKFTKDLVTIMEDMFFWRQGGLNLIDYFYPKNWREDYIQKMNFSYSHDIMDKQNIHRINKRLRNRTRFMKPIYFFCFFSEEIFYFVATVKYNLHWYQIPHRRMYMYNFQLVSIILANKSFLLQFDSDVIRRMIFALMYIFVASKDGREEILTLIEQHMDIFCSYIPFVLTIYKENTKPKLISRFLQAVFSSFNARNSSRIFDLSKKFMTLDDYMIYKRITNEKSKQMQITNFFNPVS